MLVTLVEIGLMRVAVISLAVLLTMSSCDTPSVARAPTLQLHVNQVAESALNEYAARGLKPDGLSLAAVLLRPDGTTEWAHVRGDSPVYPASLVKLFYLVAVHGFLDAGRISDSTELERAIKDMIVDSANDPTNYLLEVLTGASGGAELPDAELKAWMAQRQSVNRYFQGLGFTNVNASQKTWAEGPYGRERQGYGANFELRNSASANALAKLWVEQIVHAKGPRADARRTLLSRDFTATTTDLDDQRTAFTGKALPSGAKLWSKAGWTTKVRHDSAYVELPTGEKVVWVILTQGVSSDRTVIPTISRRFFAWFGHARA
jgi:beta-lactamase class A